MNVRGAGLLLVIGGLVGLYWPGHILNGWAAMTFVGLALVAVTEAP